MRLCIDIDGTLCRFRENGEGYADVTPLPGAVEKMKSLKAAAPAQQDRVDGMEVRRLVARDSGQRRGGPRDRRHHHHQSILAIEIQTQERRIPSLPASTLARHDQDRVGVIQFVDDPGGGQPVEFLIGNRVDSE